jgi:hypothetical protein
MGFCPRNSEINVSTPCSVQAETKALNINAAGDKRFKLEFKEKGFKVDKASAVVEVDCNGERDPGVLYVKCKNLSGGTNPKILATLDGTGIIVNSYSSASDKAQGNRS